MSILKGDNSKMEFTGITFAGKGQNLDTGAKVVHTGKNTSSYINTKSISKDGGISTFRSSVIVNSKAENSKASVSCQSLMLDSISRQIQSRQWILRQARRMSDTKHRLEA